MHSFTGGLLHIRIIPAPSKENKLHIQIRAHTGDNAINPLGEAHQGEFGNLEVNEFEGSGI